MILRQLVRYLLAVLVPLAVLAVCVRLGVRSYLIEHVMTLVIVVFALRWRSGPALTAAVTAVAGDNVLLQEPVGVPVIEGARDIVDLVLFSTIAMTIAWLVASAQRDRLRAEAAARREREAREERDRLIATVSHDLAAPLTAIRGAVQFAQRSGERGHADLGRLLTRLDTAAARATSLVRGLLDAHGLEEGLLRLDVREADLRDVVRPVVEMLDRTSDRHPVVLAAASHPLPVRCDADRMARVVENLVTNAIKYSPGGGRVEVTLEAEDGAAAVRVRDYGIGIPPEAAERVFERAYRAPNAERIAPGLGIGLHTSAEIVRRHGGTITAGPEAGGGTTFEVRLPLLEAPATRRAALGRDRAAGLERPEGRMP